jgi:pantetheine-phosphate adenylyltransferase
MPRPEIIGVYAGSFDPPTIGHDFAIRYCAKIADRLIVAVGVNPDKQSAFSAAERVNMLRDLTSDLPNVAVTQFISEYLVDYAVSIGANCIFRGIRNAADFDYESRMFHFNIERTPEIQTWLIPAPIEMVDISSSFVKGLVGPRGWEEAVRSYLPPEVYPRFVAKSIEMLAKKMLAHSKDLPAQIAEILPAIAERMLPQIIRRLLPNLPWPLNAAKRYRQSKK